MNDSQINIHRLGASFRDPSGFLFTREGILYRQVNQVYRKSYERLMASGLYQELIENQLLIPHTEADVELANTGSETRLAYKIIQPEQLDFISYPYEWSFSQLKDAALATLNIQKRALAYNMSLKDSSAYNIQFYRGHPALIDTLSFEIYQEGKPWDAYRQFCQHFLAPLALMSYRDVRLSQLLRVYIDGLPLDLTSRLLPWRTRLVLPLLFHIHLHAAAQKRFAGQPTVPDRQMSRSSFLGLIDNLESGTRRLRWLPGGTAWADYYQETNYTPAGLEHKRQIIHRFIEQIHPANIWDLGANTGLFSRVASDQGIPTLAFDVDPGAVEKNYSEVVSRGETHLLPLVQDLTNPSPGIGWRSQERLSLIQRGPADAVLALALIHHLAISNNVPLESLARFFHDLTQWLVIEFVPKNDSQVQRLLASRADIFPDYTVENFERVFTNSFVIHKVEAVTDSERRIYLMESR